MCIGVSFSEYFFHSEDSMSISKKTNTKGKGPSVVCKFDLVSFYSTCKNDLNLVIASPNWSVTESYYATQRKVRELFSGEMFKVFLNILSNLVFSYDGS